MLNKQVRLYLVTFKNHDPILCPAQSADHAKKLTIEIEPTEIFYLGWSEVQHTSEGYEISDFKAQENGNLLTGKELKSYQHAGKILPQIEKHIIDFLEDYYREARIEKLEVELQTFKDQLKDMQQILKNDFQK